MSSPRLNALSKPLRIALIQALDDAEHNDQVRAVILSGADGNFSSGADLNEFNSGQGLEEPSLHETIINFLDRMETPVISAISGTALGGGLELALATHYRIATKNARIGLPETKFGFLPGAGGTQRLPRILGVERALEAILKAQILEYDDLCDTLLIDKWVEEGDLLPGAIQFAQSLDAHETPPRVRDLPFGDENTEAFLMIAEHNANKRSTQAALERAVIHAFEVGRVDFDRGVAEEQKLFRTFADLPESAAKRYLFLAERRMRKSAKNPLVHAPEAIGIMGAGMMGRGIALCALQAGRRVFLTDSHEGTRSSALELLQQEASRGRISDSDITKFLSKITIVDDFTGVEDLDIVIEAVTEDLQSKSQAFAQIAQAFPDAVIASNTSGLDLNILAEELPDPSRLVGIHFFAPAQTMPVVEVVQTYRTSRETKAVALALTNVLNKVPVLTTVAPGFIGNRIFDRYIESAIHLFARGISPFKIDAALQNWGMKLGPFATLDLIGNDVFLKGKLPDNSDTDSAWHKIGKLVDSGRFGRKSGRGWYDYQKPRESVQISNGATQQIVEETIAPMINEGIHVLEEGVASDPSDIDVLFVNGYGFPSKKGGPMWFADTMGLTNVVRILSRSNSKYTPSETLISLANEGRRVSDWNAAR